MALAELTSYLQVLMFTKFLGWAMHLQGYLERDKGNFKKNTPSLCCDIIRCFLGVFLLVLGYSIPKVLCFVLKTLLSLESKRLTFFSLN